MSGALWAAACCWAPVGTLRVSPARNLPDTVVIATAPTIGPEAALITRHNVCVGGSGWLHGKGEAGMYLLGQSHSPHLHL
jgi:hypothetical protein